jgi:uncharacterized Zn-finger protein
LNVADIRTPHFHNTAGHPAINVGIREFMCIGARPPFDHPHVFLDMGDADEMVCPYCSTLYRYDGKLPAGETDPPDGVWNADAAHAL